MILIVEDDDPFSRLLSAAFKKMKWPCSVARNGVDAYRMMRLKGLRCILLDLRMPMIDGMEFLSIMQKEGIDVPTIIMTGDIAFDPESLRGFPNVVAFVEKPFSTDHIIHVIKKCIPVRPLKRSPHSKPSTASSP